jgi:hypothetical protein
VPIHSVRCINERAGRSVLERRPNQSLQEIGRSSPFRAAVVVGHFDAFHGCASQEKGCSKPIETFSKVRLVMKQDAVRKNGAWVRAAMSDCEDELFHDGNLIWSDEVAYTLGTSKKVNCFTPPQKWVVPAPGKLRAGTWEESRLVCAGNASGHLSTSMIRTRCDMEKGAG